MLRSIGRANVRVFVVWEPVLPTDWLSPSPALTSSVPGPRAAHFWDRGRQLSEALGGAGSLERLAGVRKIGFRMKGPVWDAALVYPPGARWGDAAKLLVAPVVNYRPELAAALVN